MRSESQMITAFLLTLPYPRCSGFSWVEMDPGPSIMYIIGVLVFTIIPSWCHLLATFKSWNVWWAEVKSGSWYASPYFSWKNLTCDSIYHIPTCQNPSNVECFVKQKFLEVRSWIKLKWVRTILCTISKDCLVMSKINT